MQGYGALNLYFRSWYINALFTYLLEMLDMLQLKFHSRERNILFNLFETQPERSPKAQG